MADVTIPREAVDAAGRAIYERSIEGYSVTMPDWDAMPDAVKLNFREAALVALNAAAPLIVAAAFEQRSRQIHAELQEEFEDLGPIQGPAAEEAMDQAKTLRRLATKLRAQS